MKHKLSLFLVGFFTINILYSQQVSEDLPKIFYKNEKTVSINLLTNGFGLGYRYGNRINYYEKRIFDVELSAIKHPKEVKSKALSSSSKSFVFGKKNSVFDLRFGYGKQNQLNSKKERGSVAIRYFYSLGGDVAFLKPIYYDITYVLPDGTLLKEQEKFNAEIHKSSDVDGRTSFFKGFSEMQFVPGAFIKGGFNFEFSQSETFIHAIEAGIIFQAYISKLDIMAIDNNQRFLFNIYACYRFGKIINAQKISESYLKKRKRRQRFFL
ncbi:MAG: hypothetical protein MI739_11340 [Bacteroidales bacterium]|nr:hypothetical protein [Bacteroidales bacterium]